MVRLTSKGANVRAFGSFLGLVALPFALEHCALDAKGRAEGAAVGGGVGGASGGASGGGGIAIGGTDGGGGDPGRPANEAGGPNGGGAGGAAGEGGTGGGGGAGGAGGACDASKGEFGVPSAAGSCYFFLSERSKFDSATAKRVEWNWDEAREDCAALGASLASLAGAGEYEDVRRFVAAGGLVGVDGDVWIGGHTDAPVPATSDELARGFTWQSGEDWTFDLPGVDPWADGEPTLDGANLERCAEMQQFVNHQMNNRRCTDRTRYALCERAAPLASSPSPSPSPHPLYTYQVAGASGGRSPGDGAPVDRA